MDNIGILLLIVFILAPLLERLLGVGRPKGPEQPPDQQPRPRQPRQRLPQQRVPEEEERPFRSIPSADADPEQSAATMLPDDLWEILTGEKRAPAPPPQRPAPPPEPARAEAPAEVRPPRETPQPRAADRRPDVAARRAEKRPLPQRDRGGRLTSPRRPPAPPQERRLPEVSMRRDPAEGRMRPAHRRESPPDDFVREIPVHEVPVVVPFETPPEDPVERREWARRRREARAERAAASEPPVAPRRVAFFRDTEDLRRAFIASEILGRPRGLRDD